ncbi:exo-alpha-sialidase [Hymenobacter aerilatus]|uniref:Exo-alpha-sialidase n=1 Tax=Hymenobacter aerilatus TaxID=2932251 RepID=A0A8T9SP38_9BACT|nr:exo-alpha-sialidase [Hymenobacter aerilatus]UOR03565.1 exo-alpha-sialidase [Hymenobacter aerilatus]
MLAPLAATLLLSAAAHAQTTPETIRYTGTTLSNVDYHHGQLRPAIGTHAQQVLRADREHPTAANGEGWTYNHASMLAYWNGQFYLQYLSNPVGEHIPPGRTLLLTSKDGQTWTNPTVIFPPYKVPDGFVKPDQPGKVAKNLEAVMHQRVGFYVSKKNRLLTLGYYGIALDAKDDPNDGQGIGRVVREVLPNGKLGPIYFLRYNKTWDQSKSTYPFYKKSKDKSFVAACEEILASPLMMQQMVEEQDRDDPLIPIHKEYKAFSYYSLPDKRVVGLWKHALTSISPDGGKSWPNPVIRAPHFVNSNAKIWGQRTSDGHYATVYNPSEFRWPLAVSTSENGLDYTDLWLVHGEITPMRYGGNYKSYGPQYVRGILPGNGTPPDGKMWVTYSVNKEDLWVASVPVPIRATATGHANDVFAQLPAGQELANWNTYSLVKAPVEIGKLPDGSKGMVLKDADKFDYAKAERVIPASKQLTAELSVIPGQNDHGLLQIEFQDAKGSPAVQLSFDSTGTLSYKAGARFKGVTKYEPNKQLDLRVTLDAPNRTCTVTVNGGKTSTYIFYAPVAAFERVMLRTGQARHFPTPDTPADQAYDLKDAGGSVPEAVFYVKSLKTSGAVDTP